MPTRFRPRVGRATVRQSVGPVTAADTRAARTAMANIVSEFERFAEHVEDASAEVIIEALMPTLDKAKVYCPKDTGALVDSAYLEDAVIRGVPTVEMGFGRGGRPDYAATVHENLEYRHKSPTRAKFLQAALEEDESAIQTRIVALMTLVGGV